MKDVDALIFCLDEAVRRDIDSALTRIGFETETWQRPMTLAARATQTRPALLVLFNTGDSRWIGAAVAEIHQASPQTKVIYATQNPSQEDANILEQGVFYYAGNAPVKEIVESAKALWQQPNLRADDAKLSEEENRYQIRLKLEETLGELFASLIQRMCEGLENVPGWDDLGPTETAALKKELHRILDHYLTAYDICGLKVSCFEMADSVRWNGSPDPAIAEPHVWEDVRILQLELKRGLSEFSDALEAAALRVLCHYPGRARTAKEARKVLDKAIKGVFGPRLFRAFHGECDMCKVVKRIDPWSIGVR